MNWPLKDIKLIYLHDHVIDLISGKPGTVVYITDGHIEKGIARQYLFEPDDHSFEPDFRYFEDLKKN